MWELHLASTFQMQNQMQNQMQRKSIQNKNRMKRQQITQTEIIEWLLCTLNVHLIQFELFLCHFFFLLGPISLFSNGFELLTFMLLHWMWPIKCSRKMRQKQKSHKTIYGAFVSLYFDDLIDHQMAKSACDHQRCLKCNSFILRPQSTCVQMATPKPSTHECTCSRSQCFLFSFLSTKKNTLHKIAISLYLVGVCVFFF